MISIEELDVLSYKNATAYYKGLDVVITEGGYNEVYSNVAIAAVTCKNSRFGPPGMKCEGVTKITLIPRMEDGFARFMDGSGSVLTLGLSAIGSVSVEGDFTWNNTF